MSTINPGSGYIKSIPGIVSSANVIPISTIAPRQRGIGYEPIVNLESGRLLLVKKCIHNWCKVSTDKYSGWIQTNNVWGIIK